MEETNKKLDYIIEQNRYIMQQNDATILFLQIILNRQGTAPEEIEKIRKSIEKQAIRIEKERGKTKCKN